ncbi:hypothetical protein V8C40DRAFT_259923 [Trichoderma camerunense]
MAQLFSPLIEVVEPAKISFVDPTVNLVGTTKFDHSSPSKSILITGAAGFIASWLTRHLVIHYPSYNIIALDKLSYCSSLQNLSCLRPYSNFSFVQASTTSLDTLVDILKTHSVDTIIHAAAQSCVDLSFNSPSAFIEDNVLGTQTLLEAARLHKIRLFLHVSTDEVYGEAEDGVAARESDRLRPTNPYAASKAAAEMFVHAYWKSYGVPVVVVRCNNVYGPGQFPEKAIPKFNLLLNSGEKVTIMGDGTHCRRYLYVADAVNALDTVLHRGELGETYNIDSEDELTTLDLAISIFRALHINGDHNDFYKEHVQWIPDRPYHDLRYEVDGSKLRSLGWKQETKISDGLIATIDWYRKFGDQWWGQMYLDDKTTYQRRSTSVSL